MNPPTRDDGGARRHLGHHYGHGLPLPAAGNYPAVVDRGARTASDARPDPLLREWLEVQGYGVLKPAGRDVAHAADDRPGQVEQHAEQTDVHLLYACDFADRLEKVVPALKAVSSC